GEVGAAWRAPRRRVQDVVARAHLEAVRIAGRAPEGAAGRRHTRPPRGPGTEATVVRRALKANVEALHAGSRVGRRPPEPEARGELICAGDPRTGEADAGRWRAVDHLQRMLRVQPAPRERRAREGRAVVGRARDRVLDGGNA